MLNDFQKKELEKIQRDVNLLENISDALKSNEEFMLEAIKHNSYAMKYAALELKNDENFVFKAIEIDCNSYIYISDELKDRENITFLAIRKDPSLYFHVSTRLKTDEDFKFKALKINSWYPWIKLNKVIKNNFFEGIRDTFAMMFGNYGILKKLNGEEIDPNELKYGLIDITLIPQLSNFLLNYGMPGKTSIDNPFKYVKDESRWNDAIILRTISCVLGFGLQFLRLAMAAAATLVVIPIVALVHLFKFPYTYYYQHHLQQLEGVIYNADNNTPTSEKTTTLEEFINTTNSSLNDLGGYNTKDITSYSSKNVETETYGSYRSTTPRLFFKPLDNNKSTQVRAKEILTKLEIDEKYNPNDSKLFAIGRSFY